MPAEQDFINRPMWLQKVKVDLFPAVPRYGCRETPVLPHRLHLALSKPISSYMTHGQGDAPHPSRRDTQGRMDHTEEILRVQGARYIILSMEKSRKKEGLDGSRGKSYSRVI